MFNYQKHEIVNLAKNNGFRSETLEKVLRLIDVLNFINETEELSPYLVLKGGTAINFTIFNLPRLSVDIDLDFNFNGTKEEMLEIRKKITSIIRRYMEINNYTLSDESKARHALDSFVFNYNNKFGNRDNLKIEINYMNRTHIYETVTRNISISFFNPFKTLTLNKYELYGSKIKALLERCTVRDVYDVYHMLKENLFNEAEFNLVKKCVIFYMIIGKTTERSFDEIINDFETKIKAYMIEKIPQYLSSTLKKDDKFSMIYAVNIVKSFISNLMELNNFETKFISEFTNGNYMPELLFDDQNIINRIKNHPMALWKISNIK